MSEKKSRKYSVLWGVVIFVPVLIGLGLLIAGKNQNTAAKTPAAIITAAQKPKNAAVQRRDSMQYATKKIEAYINKIRNIADQMKGYYDKVLQEIGSVRSRLKNNERVINLMKARVIGLEALRKAMDRQIKKLEKTRQKNYTDRKKPSSNKKDKNKNSLGSTLWPAIKLTSAQFI